VNPIQQTIFNLKSARPHPKTPPPNRWQLVGYQGQSPIVRVPGGQAFLAGQVDTNGSIVAGGVSTRQAGGQLRLDGMPRPRKREAEVAATSTFALYVCIDQTGSIGLQGAIRTIEIIDEFFKVSERRNRLVGIGYLSFGDQLCRVRDVLSPEIARAELQAVIDDAPPPPAGLHDSGYSDFFCDEGGDFPENGPDALAKAAEKLQQFKGAARRYIYMKTDTWGFAHNETPPERVIELIDQFTLTFLEFDLDGGPGFAPSTSYAAAFPENARLTHKGFELT
jgi:hypothetical protein